MKAIEISLACALAISTGCGVERKTAETQDTTEKPTAIEPPVSEPGGSAQHLPEPTRVALVDKKLEGEPGDIGATLYRIQVATGTRIDTIPKVRTMTLPGVGADGKVYLFSYSSGGLLLSAHRYDPTTRQLTEIQLPPDAGDAQVATSPDARHIAYLSSPSTVSATYGLVRSWPDGKLVAQTPPEPWAEAEVEENAVRWLDANHAEFAYHSGRAMPNLWIHAIVTLDPRGLKVDSLSARPGWAP